MRIDLHAHSLVSDGTDTPAELVAAAAAAGLDVVALTDHDTFDGLPEARAQAERSGVRLVEGIEISTKRNGVSVHLLGYGCDPGDEALARELAQVREGRVQRLPLMLAKLAELGMPLTPADVAAQVGASPSVGRPHVADALVAKGYLANRTEAFTSYLADGGPAWVPRRTIEVGRAIDLVHEAGGVAVIAHPWARVSRGVLGADALAGLVAEHRLDGIEADHGDHDPDIRAQLRALADELGLLVTGSSDYHGTGKVGHDLGSELTAPEVFNELARRLGW